MLEVGGAARDRAPGHVVGGVAARGGQAAARRAGQDRRLPGRRPVSGAVAGPVRPTAWSPVGPGRYAAAVAVPETPVRARLREPVSRGRRLAVVAAVLPHRPGP